MNSIDAIAELMDFHTQIQIYSMEQYGPLDRLRAVRDKTYSFSMEEPFIKRLIDLYEKEKSSINNIKAHCKKDIRRLRYHLKNNNKNKDQFIKILGDHYNELKNLYVPIFCDAKKYEELYLKKIKNAGYIKETNKSGGSKNWNAYEE